MRLKERERERGYDSVLGRSLSKLIPTKSAEMEPLTGDQNEKKHADMSERPARRRHLGPYFSGFLLALDTMR